MRKFIFVLHRYVALLGGAFLLVFGVTGSIMAFEPELEHLTHPHLSYVKPQAQRMSLAQIGAAVSRAFPDAKIRNYGVATAPNLADQVQLGDRAVFVNPFTAEVLGSLANSPDWLARVHQLHLRLLIRTRSDPGKQIMSWAGVTLLFLLLTGLVLWWPLKRLGIRRGAKARRFWFDLHSASGIYAFVFLFLLGATGIVIGFERSTTPLLYRLTSSEPAQLPRPKIEPPAGATPLTADQVFQIARGALPGAVPFFLSVPSGPAVPWLVSLRFPEDLTPGGRSRMMIDPYTGNILFAQSSRDAPGGTRAVITNRALHTGDIFGIPGKTIASMASLALLLQLLSGYAMWWHRTRRKRTAEPES